MVESLKYCSKFDGLIKYSLAFSLLGLKGSLQTDEHRNLEFKLFGLLHNSFFSFAIEDDSRIVDYSITLVLITHSFLTFII